MRSNRTRYLFTFFAAMLLANNALAVARACVVHFPAPKLVVGQVLHTGGDERLCSAPDDANKCPEHVTGIRNSGDLNLFIDPPSVALGPQRVPLRVGVSPDSMRLVVASAPPIVGPPLTILFHNLRN